ncbi:uncharacterized protein LOC131307417 [Rhododendron vialii]|uniref:uncharacterized protein LOC131307417 n=1 Tax=Rhododendron vialii TaxID=182163 RepID=UPI00265EBF12|nr:uncharacterized protein LOC131307417 [Rhododendron vialii]
MAQKTSLHLLKIMLISAPILGVRVITQNRSSNRYNGNPNQRNIGGDHRQTEKPRMYCDYCDRNNHNQDTCYRLHGYPTDKPRGSSNNHRLSSSSSSGAPRSNDRAMVAAPLITQDQYNNILAMLSSGSINSQANLAGPVREEDDWTG